MKLHIKRGDKVKVLSGKYRGHEGEVLVVFPKKYRAIVEGANFVMKHSRPSQEYPEGGIIKQEASIHLSNLMLIEGKEATRTGRIKNEDGKGWLRYSKNTGEIV